MIDNIKIVLNKLIYNALSINQILNPGKDKKRSSDFGFSEPKT